MPTRVYSFERRHCSVFSVEGVQFTTAEVFNLADVFNEKQVISYGEYGKPYLRDYPNVHFNISHSGQYVVCAVYDKHVGIDVQEIVPYNPAVARRVFTATDISEIENSQQSAFAFTKAWTQKEAYLKMIGCGFYNSELSK